MCVCFLSLSVCMCLSVRTAAGDTKAQRVVAVPGHGTDGLSIVPVHFHRLQQHVVVIAFPPQLHCTSGKPHQLVHMHPCMYVRVYACLYACIYVSMYVSVYVCMYACEHMCDMWTLRCTCDCTCIAAGRAVPPPHQQHSTIAIVGHILNATTQRW
jgi:hypothetical protein